MGKVRTAETASKQYWGQGQGRSLKVRLGGTPYKTKGYLNY